MKASFTLLAIILVIIITAFCQKREKRSSETRNEYPASIDAILEQPKELDIIIALQQKIDQKRAKSGYESLTRSERVFLCVEGLEAEVNNGGFDQYFFNSAGDLAQDAPDAFMAIGANHTAEIVRNACAVFPDRKPPRDRERRQELLDRIGKGSEERLSKLDDEFYKYKDNLGMLLIEYIRNNKDQFK